MRLWILEFPKRFKQNQVVYSYLILEKLCRINEWMMRKVADRNEEEKKV